MSSNDSLSSYVTANENLIPEPSSPILNDKSLFRVILFAVLGLSSLVGWNTWITAKPYFALKFKSTIFADNFNNFFSLGYMSCYMLGLVFLIAMSGIASSLLSGIFSLAASYPAFYTSAITSGQGIGGLIPSVSQLIIQLINPQESNSLQISEDGSAKAYFLISVLLSMFGLLSYIALLQLEKKDLRSENSGEVQYFIQDDESDRSEDSKYGTEFTIPVSRSAIFLKISWHMISVFLTLCITLALFPSITSSILPHHDQTNLFITVHFLLFNMADWIGKSIPGLFSGFSKISRPTLHILSLSRLIFIPLFFHCNVYLFDNDHHKIYNPTVWFGDQSFFILLIIFALSNGMISTLLLMDAPSLLQETPWHNNLEAQRFVGDCMVFGLGSGLTVGALSSFALRSYLCQCNPFTSS